MNIHYKTFKTKIIMSVKDLYEKHEGVNACYCGVSGVVCGYDDTSLIMAVNDEHMCWDNIDDDDVIITHKDNIHGYLYIDVHNIID